MSLNTFFFKYFIYYPVTIGRGEYPGIFLKKLLVSQYFDSQTIRNLQEKKFLKLVHYAKKYTKYYNTVIPDDIIGLKELNKIPLLNKDVIRNQPTYFHSMHFNGITRAKTTGGSTGAPVTIVKNNFGMAKELAATWRGYSWANVNIGDKQVRFWGMPLDKKAQLRAKMIDFTTNRIRFSAFRFSENDISEYAQVIKRKKPIYIYGYVSMIRQFCQYVQKYNLGREFNFKCIITTSEVLTDSDRIFISSIFNCPVYNEYGCGEIGTIAHECAYGKLHISAENMIVEIVDNDGRQLPNGEPGEIVITDLTNFSMPLIRYRMKDYGCISNEVCPCGINLPILAHIYGREYDIVQNSSGTKFHGEFFLYMVEDAQKAGIIVDGFQLEQLAIDHLLIRAVCSSNNFFKFKKFMERRIKKDFDVDTIVSFENSTAIPREKSGKIRVIKGLI